MFQEVLWSHMDVLGEELYVFFHKLCDIHIFLNTRHIWGQFVKGFRNEVGTLDDTAVCCFEVPSTFWFGPESTVLIYYFLWGKILFSNTRLSGQAPVVYTNVSPCGILSLWGTPLIAMRMKHKGLLCWSGLEELMSV